MQTAQINLGYASVTSPIAGRIGRALVTEGALVGQGEATQLAVVQQIDPLYVNFTQPATEVLRLRAAIASGALQERRQRRLGGGDACCWRTAASTRCAASCCSRDLSVDPSSGQITLRAEVPNPKGALLPGLYVRVRLEQAQVPSAHPAAAAGGAARQRRRHGDGGRRRRQGRRAAGEGRPRRRAGQWVVLDGLQAGEQVMVDGFQKIRAERRVKPVPWQAAASGAAAPAHRRRRAPPPRAGRALRSPRAWHSSSSTGPSSRG